jgi:hypothetical protein
MLPSTVSSAALRFLAPILACSLVACAPAEPVEASSSEQVSTAWTRFEATSFELDLLVVIGEESPASTRATVWLEPTRGELNSTLVFGLLPAFFETTIQRTETDSCGVVHYHGVSAVHPEWWHVSSEIHLIDARTDTCKPASASSAVLTTVTRDGRTTRSLLHLDAGSVKVE